MVLTKETFKITGMHCQSCELLVKEDLEDAGAKTVKASHEKELLELEYNPHNLSKEKVKEIVSDLGFKILD